MKKIILTAAAVCMLSACQQTTKDNNTTGSQETEVTTILHESEVKAMTPDQIVTDLLKGNERYVGHKELHRNSVVQLKVSAVEGQHPEAIILSCIDSRVPVELLFDKGVGDIFVTRVAGNVISGDILGSMEYACGHSGSKVVMVLGHTHCGAVHSAIEGAAGGNMTDMLAKINPAIDSCKVAGHDGEELEAAVVETNVHNMIKMIRAQSEELSHLEEEGVIRIVGAVFDLETGKVTVI